MIKVENYNRIKSIMRPLTIGFVILFFVKEASFIWKFTFITDYIPDLVFLLIFLIYTILEYLPDFRPDLIEGYIPPVYTNEEIEDEDEEELDPREKELKELKDIAL